MMPVFEGMINCCPLLYDFSAAREKQANLKTNILLQLNN